MKRKRSQNVIWLICIFALCAYAFWHTSQKQFTSITRKEIARIDETNTLSQEDMQYLEQFQAAFRNEFEIELIIKIVNELDSVSEPRVPSYICIVVAPAQKKHRVSTSRLVNALIGKKNINTYNQQYLQPNIQAGKWQTGLTLFLNALTEHLSATLNKENDNNQPLL